MALVVFQLIRRLTTPAVASVLAKEELCLALAAIARLAPLTSFQENTFDLSAVATEPLVRRSLRLMPSCTAQELKMIANGASALRWPTTAASSSLPLTDALIHSMYRQVYSPAQSSGVLSASPSPARRSRPRLGDVLAIVQQTLEASNFFNATVHAFCTEYVMVLVCQSASLSPALAMEMISTVCAYLGEQEGKEVMLRTATALADRPAATFPGVEILRQCMPGSEPLPLTGKWLESYTRWSQQRLAVLRLVNPSSKNIGEEESDKVEAQQQHKARCEVLHVVRALRAHEENERGAAGVTEKRLLQTIEAVKFYQINDPVTAAALDGALVTRLRASFTATISSTAAAAYENAAYADARRFPHALALLRQRDERAATVAQTAANRSDNDTHGTGPAASSVALQPVPALRRVYAEALRGACISEKDMFLVGNDIHAYAADDVAQALFIFAQTRSVPSELLLILSASLPFLTLEGEVALLRASRHDRAGALRTITEASLADTVRLQRSVTAASVETLAALSEVLAQPPSRWVSRSKEQHALEDALTDMVLAQAYQLIPELSWDLLCALLGGVGKLQGSEDVVHTACDRLASLLARSDACTTLPSIGACVRLLEALCASQTVGEERLLDRLAAAFAEHFGDITAAPTSNAPRGDSTQLRHLLRVVSLQLEYGSPEIADAVASVVQAVSQAESWTEERHPTAVLVAAALFALDSCNVSSSLAATVALPHRVLKFLADSVLLQEGHVSADVIAALIELLYRLPTGDAEVLLSCVQRLLPMAAAGGDAVKPLSAAQLVSVAHSIMSRTASAATTAAAVLVPPELHEQVRDHLQGLPPAVFTSLCLSVSRPSFDEALANRLVEVIPLVADKLTAHQLSQCVYGLGEMRGAGQRLSHQVMTEALSNYVVDNVDLFTSSRNICTLLHGFAKLQCTKRNLYSVFATQLKRRAVRATADFQTISFFFFAFGSARFVDKQLVDIFTRVYIDHVEELAAPDLLLTLRGMSRLSLLNSPLYWRLGSEVVKRADEFPLQAQCDLLRAYGELEQRHPVMAAALVSRIAANVSALPSVSEAVRVLTSLWLMDFKVAAQDETARIAAHVVEHAGELMNQDMLLLCSIVRDAEWPHRPLLEALAKRSMELRAQEQLEPTVARMVLDALSANFVHHPEARASLSQLARSVSKEVVQLSSDEQDQLNLLTSP